jgi:hypothetical protein
VTGAATTRRTRRKPAIPNGAMTETVTALLADLGPLDPERAVYAELARKLAATLDRMGPSVAARMTGQTSGQLLKVLDKLGVQRGGGIASTSGRRPPSVQAEGYLHAVQTTSDDAPALEDEPWYQDWVYAEKLDWIFRRHARRRGLPAQGTPQFSRAPWGGFAVRSPSDWIREQREIAATKPFRPLAVLEHGDPVGVVVPLRG